MPPAFIGVDGISIHHGYTIINTEAKLINLIVRDATKGQSPSWQTTNGGGQF
jgi:hypothetical protein